MELLEIIMIIAQIVNIPGTLGPILGLLYFCAALRYGILSSQIIQTIGSKPEMEIILRVFQSVLASLLLILSGGILVFHGWRLSPLLMFKDLLITIVMIYLTTQDWKRIQP